MYVCDRESGREGNRGCAIEIVREIKVCLSVCVCVCVCARVHVGACMYACVCMASHIDKTPGFGVHPSKHACAFKSRDPLFTAAAG